MLHGGDSRYSVWRRHQLSMCWTLMRRSFCVGDDDCFKWLRLQSTSERLRPFRSSAFKALYNRLRQIRKTKRLDHSNSIAHNQLSSSIFLPSSLHQAQVATGRRQLNNVSIRSGRRIQNTRVIVGIRHSLAVRRAIAWNSVLCNESAAVSRPGLGDWELTFR